MKELTVEGKKAEKHLSNKPGAYTVGDIATATGLPVLESRYALEALMGKYTSRLEVTENGDLIYDFGNKLERRGEIGFKERFQGFLSLLWKGFTYVYKAMIAVVLVVYFAVFIVVLIAMVIAASASSDGDGPGEGIGRIISEMFQSIFYFNTHTSRRYRPRDRHGYPYEHYEPRKTHFPMKDYKTKKGDNPKIERLKEKSFIASVYDFVFGPPRIDEDPLDNHKEVASFLRTSKGIVSTSELQALAGWNRAEASEFLTTCLTEFDGKAEINENGVLYGEFDDLIRTSQDTEAVVPIEYFWDEYVPEYELTGNSGTRNAMIIAMNTFNLAAAGYVLGFGLPFIPASMWILNMALGVIPLVYSIIFFLIPVIRSFYIKRMQEVQHVQNIRKRLMEVVFKKHTEQITLHELTEAANKLRKTEEKLNEKVVQDTLDDFILDFDGTASVDANGEVVYDFHHLTSEVLDIEKIRNEKLLDSNIGERLQLGYEDEEE